MLREKPRELTGPYEKPTRRKGLHAVSGVPDVRPDVLQRRLDFLLSPKAAEQQLAEPMRPGMLPYAVEVRCWERQMRDLRRIYRAQYLQKLAEVTEIERQNEAELHKRMLEERKRRKQAHLQRVGEDMKRRAILKDRQRIEAKVSEAMEMARRSKWKRIRLHWFRRMENLSKLIVSAENFEDALGQGGASSLQNADGSGLGTTPAAGAAPASGVLLQRNVSVPFLLRQLGGAKGFPKQKSYRIPIVDNIHRDILESSYDILAEDAPRFEAEPLGPSTRDRATELYSAFSQKEKMSLLNEKINMLKKRRDEAETRGIQTDQITIRLLDELEATKIAAEEQASQDELRALARSARGEDPAGLPSGTQTLTPASAPLVLPGEGKNR